MGRHGQPSDPSSTRHCNATPGCVCPRERKPGVHANTWTEMSVTARALVQRRTHVAPNGRSAETAHPQLHLQTDAPAELHAHGTHCRHERGGHATMCVSHVEADRRRRPHSVESCLYANAEQVSPQTEGTPVVSRGRERRENEK